MVPLTFKYPTCFFIPVSLEPNKEARLIPAHLIDFECLLVKPEYHLFCDIQSKIGDIQA